ncbi:MAG: aldehyde dehydrogenase family protein [Planctomycetota bacterium]
MATATATPPKTRDAATIADARTAQTRWAAVAVRDRVDAVRAVRRSLVDEARDWADEITTPGRRNLADSLAAEVLPTADACRFLERNAAKILRETRPPRRDRPLWGRGLQVRLRREPSGVVLVIGAWNYPLILPGVQTLQALAAGNAVLIKPAPGCSGTMRRLAAVLQDSGVPDGLVTVLDESPGAARQAMSDGVDRVVLTGSATTGRAVLRQAAETITPCTVELSGCDAVFVLPGADRDRVAAAVAFGLRLNGSCTCLGPRRIFVTPHDAEPLKQKLREHAAAIPPTVLPQPVAELAERLVTEATDAGAKPLTQPNFDADAFAPAVLDATELGDAACDLPLLQADLFAPVVSIVAVRDAEHALELSRRCPYALGASVFGPPGAAEAVADRVEAGCVTVNDLVAPTADPRAPFGGWNSSGFGVTRGAEGLLEMTRLKAVVSQTAGWLPHLDPPRPGLDRLVIGLLRLSHGRSLGERWRGLRDVIAAGREK